MAELEPVHFSRLKLMAQSPAHYAARPHVETRSVSLGAAIHTLALGGDLIVYDGERRGLDWAGFKAVSEGAEPFIYNGPRTGKAWAEAKRAALEAGDLPILGIGIAEQALAAREVQRRRAAAGRYSAQIVTSAERDEAMRAVESVLSHPIAAPMLAGARREVPFEWTFLGRRSAGTVDALTGWVDDVIELKSARTSDPRRFVFDAIRQHYHAQLAWYGEGVSQVTGRPVSEHHVITVESWAPYVVTVFRLTERTLELGRRVIHGWMERLLACEAANEWPGYVQSIVDLDIEPELELTGFEEIEE